MQDDRQLLAERAEIVIDDSGMVLCVSAEGRAGRHVEGLAAGGRVFDRIHPDDRDIAGLLSLRASRDGKSARAEIRWARPHNRWSKALTSFERDAPSRIRLTLRDDDVRELRRSEEQLRHVVEGSAQGVVVRTREQVLYMNDSFARILGYPSYRECIASQAHINDMIHAEDLPLVTERLEARIRGEEAVSHYEFRLVHRDGTTIWVEAHAANAIWDGKPASLAWINDIAKRREVEEESRRSKEAAEYANRTKTQFLANMSHELRTPLNAILGFSEVIKREMFGPIAPKYVEYAADIHKSGSHLLALVNDVLDLSKLEAGKLELHESDVSVPALVEDCVGLVKKRAEEGQVRLIADLPQDLPLLCADARAVKQLLLNFLSNAVKFTPEGGEVRVTADCDARTGFSIFVSDTGIGMTNAEIEVALSPFGQIDSRLARKHEGTGLGLPICRALMELHGGELSVASKPDVGTTLTARFPAQRIVCEAARAS